ncbi:DUF4129 domain-containing protein [Stutzerimonas nosocomialis]|uniref:DUF4129 domain-containing protein n=1 Tax=Stutzerimonas nosocomialis TaxID=1056496 RepID=UPI001107D593|nr:DUF4129 domain-containing protein [Stutzerimonas nosocomialis]TLX54617.1 DUF4129 domain-containing protein [Stutzerimonas nosocomialis]
MRLSDATMAIRPRSTWEALDLGTLLARRHAPLLMLSWALLTLPVFTALSLLFWQYPGVAFVLFWWLKPLYERLPLLILSRALFGDTPTLRQSLAALPSALRSQWLASITWRRFSTTRSFDLPVIQLEGLSGRARRQRLAVLAQQGSGTATWLTIVGMHLETALWLGLLAALYVMLPAQLMDNWSWSDLLGDDQQWLWLEHLSNLLYVLVLVVWEPIYVACGFSLYLNRRTILEGWDIELGFRRLQQRLAGVVPALLIAIGLWTALPTGEALAQQPAATQDAELASEESPKAERLLSQPLTSKAASEQIQKILDNPPFEHRETVTRWRFGDPAQDADGRGSGKGLLDAFSRLADLWKSLDVVAQVLEAVLWAAVIAGFFLLCWRYRTWLQVFGSRLGLAQRPPPETPTQRFGLELAPKSLPADVAGEAERLWAENPREALGLLYRALLSHLVQVHRLPLKDADTEGEVIARIRALEQPPLHDFARLLTLHWQNAAYGHRMPAASVRDQLCGTWRDLFGTGHATRDSAP